MQTEKAKSSYFDRTRGDKNQIFPTLGRSQYQNKKALFTDPIFSDGFEHFRDFKNQNAA